MENPEENFEKREFQLSDGRVWIAIVLAVLVATSGYALFRLSQEDQQRAELIRTNQALQSSLNQAKGDLTAAVERLNAADARTQSAQLPPPAAQPEPVVERAVDKPAPVRAVHKTRRSSGSHRVAEAPKVDPRWSEMDAKLAEQQKQIEGAKSDIAKTRSDLEGSLGSTRDELNGSIARTHEEIVELRKRGERNYYEFNLNKSSEFARTGPVSLSLRKANVKHKYFDLALIVDDQRIEKKHVNLYEPLWISVPGEHEPVQVVVNSISKNNVKGYLSESKYKKSEVSSNDGAHSTVVSSPNTPAAAQPALAAADNKSLKQSLQ